MGEKRRDRKEGTKIERKIVVGEIRNLLLGETLCQSKNCIEMRHFRENMLLFYVFAPKPIGVKII